MFSLKIDDKNTIESDLISRIQIELKSSNNINRYKTEHNRINTILIFTIYDERVDPKFGINEKQLL